MSTLMVRKAKSEDARRIAEIISEAVAEEYCTFRPKMTPEEVAEQLVDVDSDETHIGTYVMSGDSGIIGAAIIEPSLPFDYNSHVANIEIFISPDNRKEGFGRMMCIKCFDYAKHLGYTKVYTHVMKKNRPARIFYEKMGFRPIGIAIEHVKYRGNLEDVAIIERPL